MFGLGYGEILLIVILGLFLFGAYLPSAARSAGKAVASVRTEARKIKETVNPLA
jgi:Sec-independent protein translocase protein TatA